MATSNETPEAGSLKSLVLYDSDFTESFLRNQIFKCHNLEYLDVSLTPTSDRIELTEIQRPEKFKLTELLSN